jgi:hypothetical protein
LDIALRDLEPGLSFGFLADAGDRAITVMNELKVSNDEASGSFRRLAEEGFSTGRTLDEQLSLIRDGFTTNLGRIGGGTGQYVQSQREAYRGLTDAIEGLASDDTWGPLTRRFSLATRVGMSAFFTPMQRNSEQTTTMFERLSEAIGRGGIAGRFEAIRQLGIAGIFLNLSDASRDMAGAVEAAEEKANGLYTALLGLKIAGETFAPVLGVIIGAFLSLKVATSVLSGPLGMVMNLTRFLIGPFIALGSSILSATLAFAGILGWPLIIAGAVAAIVFGISALPDEVKSQIAKFVDVITDGVDRATAFLKGFDGAELANSLIETLSQLPGRIAAFFSGMMDNTTETAQGPLGQAVSLLGNSLADMFGELFRIGGEFFGTISDKVVTFFSGLFEGFSLESLGQSALALGSTIGGFISNAFGSVSASSLGDSASTLVGSIGTAIANAFGSLFDPNTGIGSFLASIPDRFLNAMVQLGPMIEQGGEWLLAFGQGIAGAIEDFDLAGTIDSFFNGLFSSSNVNSAVSGIDWDTILQGIMGALFNIGKAVYYIGVFAFQIVTALGFALFEASVVLAENLLQFIGNALMLAWEGVSGLFRQLGENLYGVLSDALGPLMVILDPFIEYFQAILSGVMGFLNTMIVEPFRMIHGLLSDELSLRDALFGAITRPLRAVFNLVQPLVTGILNVMNTMIGGIASFVNGAIGLYNRAAAFVPGLSEIGLIDTSGLQFVLPDFGAMPGTEPAGEAIVDGVAAGMNANAGVMTDAAEEAANRVMSILPQSPPRDPSSPFHALPTAGYSIMQSIAEGMDSGLVLVTEVIGNAYNLIAYQLSELATSFSDMFSIQSAFGQNIQLIGEDIAFSFERIGGEASAAFARGVIETQRDRLTQVQRDLATLFTDVYQNVRIESVTEAGDSVTLSVDSVRSITDSIVDMKNAVVTRLDAISQNTLQTAVNTSLRGGPGATMTYSSGV